MVRGANIKSNEPLDYNFNCNYFCRNIYLYLKNMAPPLKKKILAPPLAKLNIHHILRGGNINDDVLNISIKYMHENELERK